MALCAKQIDVSIRLSLKTPLKEHFGCLWNNISRKKKEQTTVLCGLRVTQNLFPQFYLANEVIQTLHEVALVTPVSLDAKL